MPSLDSHDFITLRGESQQQASQVAVISRDGIDGVRARLQAKRAEPSRYVGIIDTENVAAAEAKRVALSGLQGSVVTLTDDLGTEFTNVLVLLARPIAGSPRVALSAVGGEESSTDRVMVTFEFLVQLTEV